MSRYITSTETRTETKVYKFIYLRDFFFIFIYLVASGLFSEMVYSSFQVFYWIFTAIVVIFLVMPSLGNPKRRNYMAIYIMITADKKVYKPLPYSENFRIEGKFQKDKGGDMNG